jgi:hypothetical protein
MPTSADGHHGSGRTRGPNFPGRPGQPASYLLASSVRESRGHSSMFPEDVELNRGSHRDRPPACGPGERTSLRRTRARPGFRAPPSGASHRRAFPARQLQPCTPQQRAQERSSVVSANRRGDGSTRAQQGEPAATPRPRDLATLRPITPRPIGSHGTCAAARKRPGWTSVDTSHRREEVPPAVRPRYLQWAQQNPTFTRAADVSARDPSPPSHHRAGPGSAPW